MVYIKLAEKDDFEFYYQLKSEDFNISWGGHNGKPDYDRLKVFFQQTISGYEDFDKRKLYIIYDDEEKIGEISIIPTGKDCEVPMSLCTTKRGAGRAEQAFKLALKEVIRYGYNMVVGRIREDNIASMMICRFFGGKISKEYEQEYIPTLNCYKKMYKIILDPRLAINALDEK